MGIPGQARISDFLDAKIAGSLRDDESMLPYFPRLDFDGIHKWAKELSGFEDGSNRFLFAWCKDPGYKLRTMIKQVMATFLKDLYARNNHLLDLIYLTPDGTGEMTRAKGTSFYYSDILFNNDRAEIPYKRAKRDDRDRDNIDQPKSVLQQPAISKNHHPTSPSSKGDLAEIESSLDQESRHKPVVIEISGTNLINNYIASP